MMYSVFVSTYQGVEESLLEELQEIGISESRLKLSRRGVAVSDCSIEEIYRFNYILRTGLRVLLNLEHLEIEQASDLYDSVKSIDWTEWFGNDQTFKIDAVANRSELFNNSLFAARLTKDAIADLFREKTGERPSVDFDYPDIRIHILISGSSLTVSLDSSGDSLHKRGYKTGSFRAPLSEVLASCMLRKAGFTKEMTLYDPMCGSGTILCEGYMMATNTPAGKFRKRWAFQEWKNYNRGAFFTIMDECDAKRTKYSGEIIGGDQIGNNVGLTKENLGAVGCTSGIADKIDFFESTGLNTTPGLLLTNPPYGERIELSEAREFYKSIGDVFKKQFSGWSAGVFSANIPASKALGLKPKRRYPLWNGPLEGRLFMYDLY